MSKLRFEWDDTKAQINVRKHGVTFEEAATVFDDADAILFDDPDHSQDEDRFILLGMSLMANVLIVCHCYRNEDQSIRIISARKATKKEAEEYAGYGKEW